MKQTRRQFLRHLGIGAGASLLANAGLPLALAGNRKDRHLGDETMHTSPDVELLIGDVLGFALTSDAWAGAFGWVNFRLHQAWHNGENVYYIRTDASDADFAAANRLVHVPLLRPQTEPK